MCKRYIKKILIISFLTTIFMSLFLASCARLLVEPVQLSVTNKTLSIANSSTRETTIQLLNPTNEQYFRYE
jgi:hypothetical protein